MVKLFKETEELGYTETSQSFILLGFDIRSKLIMLVLLVYGVDVDEVNVSFRVIKDLDDVDYDHAKLLGFLENIRDRLSAFVSPCYLSFSDSPSSTIRLNDTTTTIIIS